MEDDPSYKSVTSREDKQMLHLTGNQVERLIDGEYDSKWLEKTSNIPKRLQWLIEDTAILKESSSAYWKPDSRSKALVKLRQGVRDVPEQSAAYDRNWINIDPSIHDDSDEEIKSIVELGMQLGHLANLLQSPYSLDDISHPMKNALDGKLIIAGFILGVNNISFNKPSNEIGTTSDHFKRSMDETNTTRINILDCIKDIKTAKESVLNNVSNIPEAKDHVKNVLEKENLPVHSVFRKELRSRSHWHDYPAQHVLAIGVSSTVNSPRRNRSTDLPADSICTDPNCLLPNQPPTRKKIHFGVAKQIKSEHWGAIKNVREMTESILGDIHILRTTKYKGDNDPISAMEVFCAAGVRKDGNSIKECIDTRRSSNNRSETSKHAVSVLRNKLTGERSEIGRWEDTPLLHSADRRTVYGKLIAKIIQADQYVRDSDVGLPTREASEDFHINPSRSEIKTACYTFAINKPKSTKISRKKLFNEAYEHTRE